MSLQTLNDISFAIAGRDQPQLLLRKMAAKWEPISSQAFTGKVAGVAKSLRSWGISPGDRVAILSENRHEWVVADFATMALGAVVVPIYTTLTAEQTAYILRDSGARAIFVSSQKHLEKVLGILEATVVEKMVVMDELSHARAVNMSGLMQSGSDPQIESTGRRSRLTIWRQLFTLRGRLERPKG